MDFLINHSTLRHLIPGIDDGLKWAKKAKREIDEDPGIPPTVQ